MDTIAALLFTAYMIPVNLLDNVLRPLVDGAGTRHADRGHPDRGHRRHHLLGLTGLFLGPIVLAVIWELLVAWIRESESA